jgi:hypothetical protein
MRFASEHTYSAIVPGNTSTIFANHFALICTLDLGSMRRNVTIVHRGMDRRHSLGNVGYSAARERPGSTAVP